MKNDKLEHDDDSVAPDEEEEAVEMEDDNDEEEEDEELGSDDESTKMEEGDALDTTLAIKTVEDDPDDDNVIKTWSDITGFRYYHGDNMVSSKEVLETLTAANASDPAKGVPEELFWVAFKRGATGTDQQVPWTTVVYDGKERHLDRWVHERKRKTPSKKREKLFPAEVEEHAISVYERVRSVQLLPVRQEIAAGLHKKWGELGFDLS